jgi:AcrR family transcriptional regulator
MGITERKEREKAEMRDLILQAASDLFVERGYDQTSIRTIADKIEYSPATIYLYFKDKQELFHAIMDKAFEVLLNNFRSVEDIGNPILRMRALAEVYMKFAYTHPALYDLMFIMTKPMDHVEHAEDWECGFQAFNVLLEIVEECLKQNLIKFDHAHLAALTIWSHLHGLIALHIRGRLIMIPEEMHENLISASVNSMIELIQIER